MSSDTTLTDIVPAGSFLEYVIFYNSSGVAPTLDLGSTALGNEIFINQEISASGFTVITCPNMFSLIAAQTLYLNANDAGSDWNGATVDVYFVMRAII